MQALGVHTIITIARLDTFPLDPVLEGFNITLIQRLQSHITFSGVSTSTGREYRSKIDTSRLDKRWGTSISVEDVTRKLNTQRGVR